VLHCLVFRFGLESFFSSSETTGMVDTVIREIRLPRVLGAIAVGGILGLAGAMYQAVLRNPLAEPFTLGVSSGAAFGAVLSGFLMWTVFRSVFAFVGALTVVCAIFVLARRSGRGAWHTILLSGVMLSILFSSGTMLLLAVSDTPVNASVVWLMGNMGGLELRHAWFLLALLLVGVVLNSTVARATDQIMLGDDWAESAGVNVPTVRWLVLVSVSFLVAIAVSLTGPIGFVGLVIPHIVRLLLGSRSIFVLLGSAVWGAVLLLVSDLIARRLFAPVEIPVGIVTSFIGAPVFIYLLISRKRVVAP
jgi:iron complex transport system permease protein